MKHLSTVGFMLCCGDQKLGIHIALDPIDLSNREPRLTEIFLGENIGSNLAPMSGNHHVFHQENG